MPKFRARAEDAVMTELTQLHVMDTWRPEDHTELSGTEKVSALSSLVFFKEKQNRELES